MKKKSSILMLFCLGLMVMLFPHIAKLYHEYTQKEQVEGFKELEVSTIELDELMESAEQCNKEIFHDAEEFRDPFEGDNEGYEKFKECFDLLDGEMFAAIEIPRLELVIPIFLGATDEILDKGVGQVEGSSLPVGGLGTHTVLAGHRGMATKKMFRDLDQVIPGDKFYIHTLKETLEYEVYEQEVIYPYETESLEIMEGEDLATLVTCHPFRHNYQRLLIHAERIK